MRRILSGVGATLIVVSSAIASAAPITLDPTKYGSLKQSDLDICPQFGCGPTAAVNSFVFLQNQYPRVYDLVGNDLESWKLVGELLAGFDYMDTCCGGGTPIEKFIVGKERWIEEEAPGRTTYQAMINGQWRPEVAGTSTNPIAKPAFVQDDVTPTVEFLLKEIADGEDVELFLDEVSRQFSHYVTLFKMSPATDGILNFIDPITGMPLSNDAVYQVVTLPGTTRQVIEVTYDHPTDPTMQLQAYITGAVSESPKAVPEPATVLMVIAGVGVFLRRRKRAIRRRETSLR